MVLYLVQIFVVHIKARYFKNSFIVTEGWHGLRMEENNKSQMDNRTIAEFEKRVDS